MRKIIRTYNELNKLNSFIERYRYLRIGAKVGDSTFGFDRYLNQSLYTSEKWSQVRDKVIIRDNACDLGLEGYDIHGRILIHHMNPISIEDIEQETDFIFNPEFLICTTLSTHNAIHYGNESLLQKIPIERRQNDTCPWR